MRNLNISIVLSKKRINFKALKSMEKIIDWHRSFIESTQKKLGISNYALYWFGFLEGALIMWLLTKLVAAFTNKSSELPF